MANEPQTRPEQDTSDLIHGIVADAEKLLQEQFALFRQEVRDEIARARSAAVAGGVGLGMTALGGVLCTQMLVHGLQSATKMPLWACYGLVGGGLAGGGLALLNRAKRNVASIPLGLPPKTSEAIRENVDWLKKQASTLSS